MIKSWTHSKCVVDTISFDVYQDYVAIDNPISGALVHVKMLILEMLTSSNCILMMALMYTLIPCPTTMIMKQHPRYYGFGVLWSFIKQRWVHLEELFEDPFYENHSSKYHHALLHVLIICQWMKTHWEDWMDVLMTLASISPEDMCKLKDKQFMWKEVQRKQKKKKSTRRTTARCDVDSSSSPFQAGEYDSGSYGHIHVDMWLICLLII